MVEVVVDVLVLLVGGTVVEVVVDVLVLLVGGTVVVVVTSVTGLQELFQMACPAAVQLYPAGKSGVGGMMSPQSTLAALAPGYHTGP